MDKNSPKHQFFSQADFGNILHHEGIDIPFRTSPECEDIIQFYVTDAMRASCQAYLIENPRLLNLKGSLKNGRGVRAGLVSELCYRALVDGKASSVDDRFNFDVEAMYEGRIERTDVKTQMRNVLTNTRERGEYTHCHNVDADSFGRQKNDFYAFFSALMNLPGSFEFADVVLVEFIGIVPKKEMTRRAIFRHEGHIDGHQRAPCDCYQVKHSRVITLSALSSYSTT